MKTRKLLIALVAILAVFAAACGDDDDPVASTGGDGGSDVSDPSDGPAIKIGAQDFGESAILAEIYGQVLTDHGYEVEQVGVGGFRDVLLGAFDSGDVNLSAEYAASMLEFLNDSAGEATGDADETVGLLQTQLDDLGLVATEPAPAVDTNAFVVTEETSDSEGYTKISDLPADGAGIELGAPQDCETNPFCLVGLMDVYDIDLSAGFTPLESGLVADALADGGDVNVGVLFSTSGRIADEGWVLLEDDMGMLAADNITPVISDELADAYGDALTSLLDDISAAIDTDTLTELNKRFDIDKEDASDIAADFISEAGL